MASHFAIPEADGVDICRALGLAVNNIAMYGPAHSVTATSVAQAFDTLVAKLDLYGSIEFVNGEAGLMINGVALPTQRSTAQQFVDQLSKLDVNDFEISPPANRGELTRFLTILAAPDAGGFENAVKDANLKTIRVSGVSYARVGKDAELQPQVSKGSSSAAAGKKIFDLDMDLSLDEFASAMGGGSGGGDFSMGSGSDLQLMTSAAAYAEHKKSLEEERNRLLDIVRERGQTEEGLRKLREQLMESGVSKHEWEDLLVESGLDSRIGPDGKKAAETLKHLLDDVNALAAQGNAIAAGKTTESMQRILDSISQEVASLAARAQGHADTLADKVDADRDTVAKLEADARAHGIGIELSREELLGSLAEINQEITQPLSVASAVVQMLSNGTLGDVPDAQKDILKVATDGMERLDKLVKYLGRISGMPQNLSPDFSIINEAYGNKS